MKQNQQFCSGNLIRYQINMTRITVTRGDGIGPKIMDATLEIILAKGAKLEID